MTLGDTFINLAFGPEHLWVVSSLPMSDGSLAIFNMTSWRQGCDESCIIMPGEHPFVTRQTIVAYERGQPLSVVAQQEIQKRQHLFPAHQPTSPPLLARIQQGALVSERTAQKLQIMVRDSLSRQS